MCSSITRIEILYVIYVHGCKDIIYKKNKTKKDGSILIRQVRLILTKKYTHRESIFLFVPIKRKIRPFYSNFHSVQH